MIQNNFKAAGFDIQFCKTSLYHSYHLLLSKENDKIMESKDNIFLHTLIMKELINFYCEWQKRNERKYTFLT